MPDQPSQPTVILSGFGDEAANQKTAEQQFAALAAIGLQYYSIRFIDAGNGIKNVMQLTRQEITKVRHLEDEYGLNVATLGSPIGKVKLLDKEDGTKNRFVPFKKYLSDEVKKACELAHAFETKLIRGFSFYHPKGTDPKAHVAQAADQLGQIAEMCHRSDLTFGLEVEANLVGQNGVLMADIHRQVDHPALVLIFDAANISTQGYSPGECFEQYLAMKKGLGWMHVKDYRQPNILKRTTHVDEEALKHFVPADQGDSGHELVLRDFKDSIPLMEKRLKKRGIPGVFMDLEPHVKGGGQFGGFSGPDGMGVALRGLCRVLDYIGIGYHLRDFEDVRVARGF
ncbi:MAG TPA: sugar phosphate isomerase/epimerase family protein [Pirellulaceae bacterium]|nr:sugar phosphate isomerase/epimerase family protein [Pirellulaceae bacterium]